MIKNILYIIAIFWATGAFADGYTARQGVVVDVQAVYEKTYEYSVQEKCFETKVPVYQTRKGSPGDALAGAIIGGAIGNQFGGGLGKDALTVLGAIIGADTASKPREEITDYVIEWQCKMVNVPREISIIDHYQITYRSKGKLYRINTDKMFNVGQHITIRE